MPVAPPDAMLPAPFNVSASSDPDFPPRPAPDGERGPGVAGLPTRQSLGFAAAPVPVDYAPPQAPDFTVPSRAAGLVLSADTTLANPADPASPASPASPQASRTEPGSGPGADPGYIWDLAATDVFPAATHPGPQEAPGAVPGDDDPGASGS